MQLKVYTHEFKKSRYLIHSKIYFSLFFECKIIKKMKEKKLRFLELYDDKSNKYLLNLWDLKVNGNYSYSKCSKCSMSFKSFKNDKGEIITEITSIAKIHLKNCFCIDPKFYEELNIDSKKELFGKNLNKEIDEYIKRKNIKDIKSIKIPLEGKFLL